MWRLCSLVTSLEGSPRSIDSGRKPEQGANQCPALLSTDAADPTGSLRRSAPAVSSLSVESRCFPVLLSIGPKRGLGCVVTSIVGRRRAGALILTPLSACCAWLLLSAGSPIGGRIRNAPKARCGLCEFHRNLSRSRQLLLHVDHAALFLFPAVYVLHEEPLPWHYFFG